MHQCPGNGVAVGRAVVYYARAAHAFSAGTIVHHRNIAKKIIFITILTY